LVLSRAVWYYHALFGTISFLGVTASRTAQTHRFTGSQNSKQTPQHACATHVKRVLPTCENLQHRPLDAVASVVPWNLDSVATADVAVLSVLGWLVPVYLWADCHFYWSHRMLCVSRMIFFCYTCNMPSDNTRTMGGTVFLSQDASAVGKPGRLCWWEARTRVLLGCTPPRPRHTCLGPRALAHVLWHRCFHVPLCTPFPQSEIQVEVHNIKGASLQTSLVLSRRLAVARSLVRSLVLSCSPSSTSYSLALRGAPPPPTHTRPRRVMVWILSNVGCGYCQMWEHRSRHLKFWYERVHKVHHESSVSKSRLEPLCSLGASHTLAHRELAAPVVWFLWFTHSCSVRVGGACGLHTLAQ
jgi:sterol desaturase/sphingolipid hydroxylase (fatty acid hydroxylase superfamily)